MSEFAIFFERVYLFNPVLPLLLFIVLAVGFAVSINRLVKSLKPLSKDRSLISNVLGVLSRMAVLGITVFVLFGGAGAVKECYANPPTLDVIFENAYEEPFGVFEFKIIDVDERGTISITGSINGGEPFPCRIFKDGAVIFSRTQTVYIDNGSGVLVKQEIGGVTIPDHDEIVYLLAEHKERVQT